MAWMNWVTESPRTPGWSGKRRAACAGLCLAASACGSHAIDVGAVPDRSDAGERGGAANTTDAGAGALSGNSTCSIPNLDQYRLVFDSDGGKLERRIYAMR